jgi:hypothetical protein
MSIFVTKIENAKTHSSVELVDLRGSCYKNTHTHTHIPNSYLYTVCDSPPRAETRHLNPSLCLVHYAPSLFCCCYVLHKDEGPPVVLPCLHKIPPASLQTLLHQDQRRCSFIPHVQVLPLIRVRSFHQHLHDSCDIHDTNEGSAVFANKRVLHFLMPLGPPKGMELGSCHLSDTNNFEKAPKFFENFYNLG